MFYLIVQGILQKVPGGVSISAEYPAGLDQNTTSGESFVVNAIDRGIRDCPYQKYAMFGYSQGATLMLRALSKLSNESVEAISSVVLVGNPYRMPGKLSNVNGTGQPGNDAVFGMFAGPALANNQTVPELSCQLDQSGKVLDFCLEVS